jgi:hypothetical protein
MLDVGCGMWEVGGGIADVGCTEIKHDSGCITGGSLPWFCNTFAKALQVIYKANLSLHLRCMYA